MLRDDAGHFDDTAAVGTRPRHRHPVSLVDLGRAASGTLSGRTAPPAVRRAACRTLAAGPRRRVQPAVCRHGGPHRVASWGFSLRRFQRSRSRLVRAKSSFSLAISLSSPSMRLSRGSRGRIPVGGRGRRLDGLRMAERRAFQPQRSCSAWGLVTQRRAFCPGATRPARTLHGDPVTTTAPGAGAAVARGWSRGCTRWVLACGHRRQGPSPCFATLTVLPPAPHSLLPDRFLQSFSHRDATSAHANSVFDVVVSVCPKTVTDSFYDTWLGFKW